MITHEHRRADPLPYTVLAQADRSPIDWLWNPYIPKGALSIIVGDGGYGKSAMTCALAADLSAGRPLPGQKELPPQRILIISAEDGISQVILPRVEALGGNLNNVAAFDDGFVIDDATSASILEAVRKFDATLVFLDPLVVYMGGDVDFFKANEVRKIMNKLTKIAKECNVAIVGVHHVKKAFAPNAQHRSLGSVDFVNGVRSAMLVDISKNGTYYMKHVKHNWSKAGATLAYGFENDKFGWLGEMHTITDTVDYEGRDTISHTPRGKARAFIIATLKDGPVPSLEFMQRAKDEGFTRHTIDRAKKGVAHSVEMMKDGVQKWYWQLNDEAMPRPETGEKAPEAQLEALAGPEQVTINGPDMQKVIEEARERLNDTRS